MIERWTRWVLHHRKTVLVVWIALFVIAGWAASGLADLLTNRFTLPGTDAGRAESILHDHFGQKSTGSFTLVAHTDGNAAAIVPPLRAAAIRASREVPTGRLVTVRPVSEHVATASIVSSLDPADAKGHTAAMRRAAGTIPDAQLYVTGQAAIEHDLDPVFSRDLKVGELYIAIPIAFLLLIFVFGTLSFLLPLIFALFSIPVTLGVVWLFAKNMEISTYVQNMVMLIGLGIAVDYSLLMVYRYREEHRLQPSREEAVVTTMATAGRAVVFSGTAVAVGLSLLLFMPLPFMRGFGVCLAIPLVSVVCALTFLPVLLYYLGDRFDRVRLVPRRLIERREDEEHNMWSRLARVIMRRPVVVAAIAIVLLLLATAPVLALDLGPGSNQGIPQNLEAVKGNNVLTAAVGAGAVAPTDIVIDTGRPGGASTAETAAAKRRLIRALRRDPEVGAVDDGTGPQFVDATGRYIHFRVIGRHEYGVPEAQQFVHRLRDDLVPAAAFPEGERVLAGGGPPSGVDFLDLTYSTFPWLVLAVLIATYLLLMRAFRSLVLPLKAILLNLLAIGASYGLLVVVFKWGVGESVGLIGFDQIEGWIPVFLFAMLFGLSMDYEVFLVSRMREEWDATQDNELAVTRGLAKTGRIVTIAGFVMFAAFMGFVAGSIVGLQQFGFGLAAAIFLDVTIVRALLVPSLMAIFGRYNWWLPARVARVVRVRPSPLAAETN
ncbi:MAG TPA: MMPL family transporter [Gaiellaceae bacterium]